MKPTPEQLKDPKWWDENTEDYATHFGSDGMFYWVFDGGAEVQTHSGFLRVDSLPVIMHERPNHSVDIADAANLSKYHHEIAPGVWVDVYDVIKAWGVTSPAQQHLVKKALQAGERGHKDYAEDMDDIIASAKRAKELNAPTR